MVIGLSVVPAMIFGVLRSRAVMKAFFGICNDLKNVGVELPQTELRAMPSQLSRNPEAILDTDNSPGVRRIKERHVKVLAPHLKRLRMGSRI